MSSVNIRLGQRVKVPGKETCGTVRFVGTTNFSQGKWVGVILDEPKGKNNGTVQGKCYFQCENNYGVFLRPTQVIVMDDDDEEMPMDDSKPCTPIVSTPSDRPKSSIKRKMEPTRLPVFGGTPHSIDSPDLTPEPVTPSFHYTPNEFMNPSSGSVSKAQQKSALFKSKHHALFRRSTFTLKTPEGANKLPLGSISRSSLRPEKAVDNDNQRHDIKKTASFVETGFVETITPQFTPGLPSPAMQTLEDKANAMHLQQENENLKNELKDFQEKLETIKIKRADDREKLKEGEKWRLQAEQLSEFKSRIMETQASLQKELQKAKQETQEAIEAKERRIEETQELMDSVEMLTLDKEMAEEKAEALQLELELAKERVEELQVDLELLKTEAGDALEPDGDVSSSAKTRQLQQQCDRLRETLVRMRDISAHDKHELQKQQKDTEVLKTEVSELSRAKEKLISQVSTLEDTIADLQEQVDAALGAEEMVETLTTRNLDLEERVEELLENVSDLEAINDMNDLLQENARDLELELREDLDLANSKIQAVIHEQEACNEVIVDQDNTIKKFRDLVNKLQEQNEDLRKSLEKETNKPLGTPSEIIDFKKMFIESKAHGKAIELELRKLEVEQANQHVSYLTHYLPDTFIVRGGDHDAVSVLLLLSRAIRKSDIVISGLKDHFHSPESFDRNTVLKSYSVDQFSFGSKMLHLLYMLQTTLQQYLYVTNTCSVETFLKIGGHYQEMIVYERNLDIYVDLLKKDQLGENTVTEPLEKTACYFETFYQSQLSGQKIHQGRYLADVGRTLGAASDAIGAESKRIKSLMHPSEVADEMGRWLSDLSETCSDIGSCAKRIRRQMPQSGSMGPVSFPNDIQEALSSILMQVYHAQKAVYHVASTCMHQTTLIGDPESGITNEKLKEFIHQATDIVYGSDDQGPDSISSALHNTLTDVSKITDALEKGEYDFDGTIEKESIPPVSLRAEMIKNELKDTEHLKYKLEHKEQDIKDLRLAIKQKNEELSQMTIRRDMAEKKLSTATKDADLTIEKLQRKLDDNLALLKRKEKEYEDTTDHLQSDIDNLVVEKGELRKKLQAFNKEKLYQALSSKTATGPTTPSPSTPTTPSVVPVSPTVTTTVKDSPMLLQQISDLKSALHHVSDAYYQKIGDHMEKQMASLKPLKVSNCDPEVKSAAKELSQKIYRLKKEILDTMVGVKVVDISKRNPAGIPPTKSLEPANHLVDHYSKLNMLRKKLRVLQDEANKMLIDSTPAGSITTSLSTFPSTQMTKAARETDTIMVGKVTVPSQEKMNNVVNILLDRQQLQELHQRILL